MPCDLARGQHDEDAEDRERVAGSTVAIALRMTDFGHVLLRVDHLLGRAVRELEADVVEEQQRHDAEEDQRARIDVAPGMKSLEAEAVDAVLEGVDRAR